MKYNKKLILLWDLYLSKIADMIDRINVFALTLIFFGFVYISLYFFGETALTETPERFLYWAMVTFSTVGYGDHSPQTEAGQLFTAFVVIPFGISLFAVLAAKFAAKAASIWYRKMKGMHSITLTGHIVIIGYSADRTPLLIEQLIREERRKIVLISKEQTENPLPESVEFINVPSFTNEKEMGRSAISQASCIIVDTDTDEMTLTVALFVAGMNEKAHLVAHFMEEIKGRLLQRTYPNAECISNLSTELLAKSVIDLGSSLVHSELVSAQKGQTQYSIQVPVSCSHFPLSEIFVPFKVIAEATIIGLRKHYLNEVKLNVKLDTIIEPGDTLYYISDERIEFNDWPQPKSDVS